MADKNEPLESNEPKALVIHSVVVSETELCQCKQPKMCSINEIDRNRCKNCKNPLWHN